MFNPDPRVQVLPLGDGRAVHVFDDALEKPERLVAYAAAYREDFAQAPGDGFPGLELRMPQAINMELDDFFRQHARRALGARRTLHMHSRLSMTTLAPAALRPPQWICRRDPPPPQPGQCTVGCVLYLFHDQALGGTRFFRPRVSARQVDQLLHDAGELPPDDFTRLYGVPAGYPAEHSPYFDHVLTVEPRWNRLLFFDGGVFRGHAVRHPEMLQDDPRHGRLTLDGFFACSRNLVAW